MPHDRTSEDSVAFVRSPTAMQVGAAARIAGYDASSPVHRPQQPANGSDWLEPQAGPSARRVHSPAVFVSRVLFGCSDELVEAQLLRCMTEMTLLRGRPLVRQGEVDQLLYVVATGKIKLHSTSPSRRSVILGLLGPGDSLGALSVLDEEPRISTATAVVDSRIFSVDKQDAEAILQQRPELALGLLKVLSQRLRRTNDMAADLAFQDTLGRVAKILLRLSARFGRPQGHWVHVRHDLTQQELADMVGCSRETINKSLSDLANRGWIRVEAGAVLLRDLDRLRNRADRRSRSATASRAARHLDARNFGPQ